ncbi:hypothetical protein PI124_g18495 [Phytophthora idaei]|nr:hypothetical protein PI125_g19215 [Phytophthora idaei]KAG3130043.1 hypothetical protein PI126_g20682 [Phytophthora idaei]KAG3236495.1 hypothetical protein PI124_g18495 [Phytophthora idaei]
MMPGYVLAQFLGAFVGGFAIYLLDYQRLTKAGPDKKTMYPQLCDPPNPEITILTAF